MSHIKKLMCCIIDIAAACYELLMSPYTHKTMSNIIALKGRMPVQIHMFFATKVVTPASP